MPKQPYIPLTISDAAQAFIRSVNPVAKVVNKDTINGIRTEVFKAALAGSEAAITEYVEKLEDVDIAGIKCQCITPKNYSLQNDNKTILYFFGGGHVTGGPFEDLAITAKLAFNTGFKIYTPYYSLAPEAPFPTGLNESFEVYKAMLHKHDASGIAICGESAGGNMALALLLKAKAAGLSMPAACALLSPWADLTHSKEVLAHQLAIDPTYADDSDMNQKADAYANGHNLFDPLVSPMLATFEADFPPTLITTGTSDFLMADCARLSTKLREAGVDVRLHLWEGMWHVFEYYPEIPEGHKSLAEIADFFRGYLLLE